MRASPPSSLRLALAGLLACALGVLAAPAGAVDLPGATSARFSWTAATGPVASYAVFVNRNAGGFPTVPDQVVTGTLVTIAGALNDTLVVRVYAQDAQGNLGPPSPDSDSVRFVAAPAIALSTQTLDVAIDQGAAAPSQSFSVNNAGGGTLSFTLTDDASWLAVTPASGTSTGTAVPITATLTTTGLAAGTYTGHVTVTASGATGSPAVVTVNLTVRAKAVLGAPGKPTLTP